MFHQAAIYARTLVFLAKRLVTAIMITYDEDDSICIPKPSDTSAQELKTGWYPRISTCPDVADRENASKKFKKPCFIYSNSVTPLRLQPKTESCWTLLYASGSDFKWQIESGGKFRKPLPQESRHDNERRWQHIVYYSNVTSRLDVTKRRSLTPRSRPRSTDAPRQTLAPTGCRRTAPTRLRMPTAHSAHSNTHIQMHNDKSRAQRDSPWDFFLLSFWVPMWLVVS